MSNHKQLHAMTGVYAKLKLSTNKIDKDDVESAKLIDVRDRFKKKLNLKDYSDQDEVNKVNTDNWVITNIFTNTNTLPKKTLYSHIKFIPDDMPDFRKVLLQPVGGPISSRKTDTLKSAPVRPVSIPKHEITKNGFTPITETLLDPKTTTTTSFKLKSIPNKSTIVNKLVDFLKSNPSIGPPTDNFTINDLKLSFDKKIKGSPKLSQADKDVILNASDEIFKNITDDETIMLNETTALDAYDFFNTNIAY